jgi:hydrogenase maturation protease
MSILSDTRAPVLLAGLGSPLMSDEGVGVYLAEEIARRDLLPPAIEVIELGTGNMNVLHAIAGRRKVVFIDCARMDAEPGTMRRFGMDEVVSRKVMPNWSAHEGDLLNLLEISRTIGELPDEVVLFGIEPVSIEYGQELTPLIRDRVEDYIAEIVEYMRGADN